MRACVRACVLPVGCRRDSFMAELGRTYEGSDAPPPGDVADWQAAMFCAAPHPADERWYRAQIERIDGDEAEVRGTPSPSPPPPRVPSLRRSGRRSIVNRPPAGEMRSLVIVDLGSRLFWRKRGRRFLKVDDAAFENDDVSENDNVISENDSVISENDDAIWEIDDVVWENDNVVWEIDNVVWEIDITLFGKMMTLFWKTMTVWKTIALFRKTITQFHPFNRRLRSKNNDW